MAEIDKTIQKAHKVLVWETLMFVLLSLLTVILFEADILIPGAWAASSGLMYNVMMLMELLTICLVPVALKMFSIKRLKNILCKGGGDALVKWGAVRISLIGLPMLLNTVFYYLFMSVAFAYMAVIGLLCFSFVYPGKDRCIEETRQKEK